MSSSAASAKALARSYLRRRRRSLPPSAAQVAALTAQCLTLWESLAPASTIAAFLPLPTEPPVLEGLGQAVALGHRVLVPVVEPGSQLSWVEWEPGAQGARNTLGIDEPDGQRLGPEAFCGADLRLVPALALDVGGRRLGQGGGYYDRLFERLGPRGQEPSTLGVVFAREILDGLPADPWDARLGWALTEQGILALNGSNPWPGEG